MNYLRGILTFMDPLRTFGIVVACAITYRAAFLLNDFLFSQLAFSPGASWVFLPGGLRLVFVLVFGVLGGAGIAAASIAGAYLDGGLLEDPITAIVAGILSGLAPLLARQLCRERFDLDDDLVGLGATELLKYALLFSLTSAFLQQLWYSWRGVSDSFLAGMAVMNVGDFLGSLLILYAAKGVLAVFLRHNLR